MKPIEISKNSWHYKFIKSMRMGVFYADDVTTCSYIRLFLGCSLMLIILVLVGLGIALSIISSIMYFVIQYLAFGFDVKNWIEMETLAAIGTSLLFFSTVIPFTGFVKDKYDEIVWTDNKFKQWTGSVLGKLCVKVVIK